NFLAAFAILLIFLWTHQTPNWVGLALAVPALLMLLLAVTAMAWGLSALQVFYRDTRFVLTFLLSISFFLTPIFYPIEFLPPDLRWLVGYNPFFILISPFQNSLYRVDTAMWAVSMLKVGALTLVLGNLVAFFWHMRKNEIYLHV